jgi:opacity protein-like surface antigen
MKQSLHSVLIASIAAMLLLATAGTAQAFSLDISTSWKMGDYLSVTNSSGVGAEAGNAARFANYTNGGVAWSAGRFERSGVNFQVGFGVGPSDRIAPYLGFGMNRVSYKNDYLIGDDAVLDEGAATQLGIELGVRGFLADRGQGLASPYLRFSFTQYIGLIDEYVEGQDGVDYYEDILCAGIDDDNCGEDYEKFDEAVLSPHGFKIAFGAEYYFNDNFSIGADLLGIEIFWRQAVLGPDVQDSPRISTYASVAFYSTLNLTYRFIPKKRAKQEKPSYDSDYDFDYED